MENLTELFCLMDDFCKEMEPELEKRLLENGQSKRHRATGLSLSELMTLMVLFHQLRYRQFKAFYIHHVQAWLKRGFPKVPSYARAVAHHCDGAVGLFVSNGFDEVGQAHSREQPEQPHPSLLLTFTTRHAQ